MRVDQRLAEVNVAQLQSRSFLPLCGEQGPAQGPRGGPPLVGLKGAVGSSHVLRLLLVPGPHFPQDAGDAAGSTSRQRQGGFCSLREGWVLFSHLLEVSGSKEKPGVGGESSHFAESDFYWLPSGRTARALAPPLVPHL